MVAHVAQQRALLAGSVDRDLLSGRRALAVAARLARTRVRAGAHDAAGELLSGLPRAIAAS